MRVKKGDSFVIGDLENNEFIGVIENINKNQIVLSTEILDYLGLKGGEEVSIEIAKSSRAIQIINKKLKCELLSEKDIL